MADENDSVSTAFLKDTFDDIASTIKTAGTNKSSTNTGTGKGGSANFTQLGLTCYSDANNKMSASKRSTFSDLNNAEFAQHCDDFVTYIASLRHPAHSQNVVATNMLAKSGGTGGDVCAFNSSGALIKGSIPTISADANTPASNKITLYNGADACKCLGSPSAVYTGVKVPSGYHVNEQTYTSYLSLYCKNQTLDVYKNDSTYNTKYPYISAGTGVVYDATTNKATHNHSAVTISFPTGYYSGTTFKLQGADLKTSTDITVTPPSATNANNVKIPVGYYGTEVNKCFRIGTATAANILCGKTAVNSTGLLIEGSMPNRGSCVTNSSAATLNTNVAAIETSANELTNYAKKAYYATTPESGKKSVGIKFLAGYWAADHCGMVNYTAYDPTLPSPSLNYGTTTATIPAGYYSSAKQMTITGPALKDAGGVTMVAPTTSDKGYAKVAAGYYPNITDKTSIQYNFNNAIDLSSSDTDYIRIGCKYLGSDGLLHSGVNGSLFSLIHCNNGVSQYCVPPFDLGSPRLTGSGSIIPPSSKCFVLIQCSNYTALTLRFLYKESYGLNSFLTINKGSFDEDPSFTIGQVMSLYYAFPSANDHTTFNVYLCTHASNTRQLIYSGIDSDYFDCTDHCVSLGFCYYCDSYNQGHLNNIINFVVSSDSSWTSCPYNTIE